MAVDTPTFEIKNDDQFVHDELQLMRASVYELLGRMLACEPDSSVLDVLRQIEGVDTSDGPLAMGWELLKQASLKTDEDAVTEEYFDLFVGVGRGELVPFGSWYITGFLMEKPLAALRADLRNIGIERQEGVRESEDHMAALSDVMSIMIRSNEPIDSQRQFFSNHIAPWANAFFNDLQNAQAARFYRSVGFFGASFIDFEKQLLAMKI